MKKSPDDRLIDHCISQLMCEAEGDAVFYRGRISNTFSVAYAIAEETNREINCEYKCIEKALQILPYSIFSTFVNDSRLSSKTNNLLIQTIKELPVDNQENQHDWFAKKIIENDSIRAMIEKNHLTSMLTTRTSSSSHNDLEGL